MAVGSRFGVGAEPCFAGLSAPLNSLRRAPIFPSDCRPGMTGLSTRMMAASRPPRRGPDAVRALRGAMQGALAARRSRLAVRMPDGAELGIERGSKGNESAGDAPGVVRGDRELARCVVALFEGTGLSVCTVFPTRGEMDAARIRWGAPSAVECAFDFWTTTSGKARKGNPGKGSGSPAAKGGTGRVGRPSAGLGFGSPAVAAGSPSNAVAANPGDIVAACAHDVYIVVSPRQQAMARVMQLCQSLGDDHLVVVLNCRAEAMRGLPADVACFFAETSSEFEDVYLWMPNPSSAFAGGVLFREFPGNYTLCRRTPLNTLQVLLESDARPSVDEITNALRAEAEKPSNTIFNKVADFLDKR
jgi:hypothetical protein